MTAKTITEKQTVSTMLIERWERTGAKLAKLAEEIPENKFETAPFAGIRTPGDVLRHVAFWNRYVAAITRGDKGEDAANELPKEIYSSKAQTLAALKESTSEAATALRGYYTGLTPDKAELAVTFIEHVCEHYGQLVVYARSLGIVPPSSRS